MCLVHAAIERLNVQETVHPIKIGVMYNEGEYHTNRQIPQGEIMDVLIHLRVFRQWSKLYKQGDGYKYHIGDY